MPRILPRLLKKIADSKTLEAEPWKPFTLDRPHRKSLYKPVPPRPSFNPAHNPRSILLAPHETNPITSSRVYVRRKTMPPRADLSGRVKLKPGDHDGPRGMTEDERRWWSSPYLRMLASPIRKCVVSDRYLPTDFLIRLANMRLPESLLTRAGKGNKQDVLIPDGLQHSKFTARKSGTANYILCSKEAVYVLGKRGTRISSRSMVHPLLTEQIAHLLRVRVLQEFELLGDEMELRRDAKYKSRIIRRLSRDEWNVIRTTGLIPYQNALAVIVLPPLQKDPVTKKRPEPSMSASPIIEEPRNTPIKPLLPLSIMYPRLPTDTEVPVGLDILPGQQTPFYNGVTMFPARPQRAALHVLLIKLLGLEYRSGHLASPSTSNKFLVEGAKDRKASHAFLLCSDEDTTKRGDVAAVAIALWRLRMFELGGDVQGG